ncbi:hypothetical protein K227x_24360 [Rubripirellula lacrimiformis]|uniref:Bacterial type II secretion system protein F domain protein n=1 Tax=Rubripirellula lacrimiformis TaxID=1930273 RepID=A0A517NA97_9BACT|nr:hypothetical protein [Rubripirellula lacrimiformis]QDT04050.1 hypothetical protein K227x_24360 [Rubripirellula lacrimiformis]
MNRTLRIVVWTLLVLLTLLCFVYLLPSLFGLVLVTLLVFGVMDFASRRHLNATRAFNSTVRAVCHHDGAISKVAVAFSRSGPLAGPCYEYARRLMMGQDPIEAAARSRVPLQLGTAVAMQSPIPPKPNPSKLGGIESGESDLDRKPIGLPESALVASIDRIERSDDIYNMSANSIDSGWMPVYGQFLYLVVTASITCLVLSFMALFIVPTLEVMFEEFGMDMKDRWLMSARPAYWILFFLSFVVLIIVPIMSRGTILGWRLPMWFPITPRLAQHKSEVLNGLADAIDAGWPMGRALAVGHLISVRRYERRSLQRAMELIEQGRTPADSIHQTGWIGSSEAAWLEGASPVRTAQLLRNMAGQTVRDAHANLRWLMSIVFPALVLMLAAAVLMYGYGFFSSLFQLISMMAGAAS